jgi:predicted DNA-binding transcriptional regulator YafY
MAVAKRDRRKRPSRASRPKPDKAKPKYSATYATASRITQLALRLLAVRQLSYADIRDMLRVRHGKEAAPPSERTIDRYVKALEAVFSAGGFGELTRQGYEEGRKYLSFTPKERSDESVTESLEIMLSMNLLQSLEGTVLRENASQVLGKLAKRAGAADPLGLQNLPMKFYVVPFGVKSYEDQRVLVDALVKALLRLERLDVHYRGLRAAGDVHVHDFEPYTLAIYKGGLYLIGYSHTKERRIFLAVERIEKVEERRGADGRIETFIYPEGYTPEQQTQGAFGIYDTGKSYDVELEILNAETVAFLAPRRFHRTQQLERRADGTAILRMRVLGLEELAPWVMSMAPWVRVAKPSELREAVRKMLAEGAALYA